MSADSEQLTLAGGFAPATDAAWEAEVLKVLNRGRPEGKELTIEQGLKRLTSTTLDDIDVAPLYTSSDEDAPLGYPGAMPFTRGSVVRTGEAVAWGVRQLHEDPDVAVTRRAILDDLKRDGTSVWLRIDPDSVGGVPTLFTGVTLNPDTPWYLRFLPTAGQLLVLLFAPAFAAGMVCSFFEKKEPKKLST